MRYLFCFVYSDIVRIGSGQEQVFLQIGNRRVSFGGKFCSLDLNNRNYSLCHNLIIKLLSTLGTKRGSDESGKSSCLV